MLETMYSIALQKNNFSSKDADNNIINQNNSSKSIFNELNKYFMSKEIEFDNVFTKEKKDDDTTVISANFAINNLLNILNKKDIYSKNNFVRDDITKKKLDKYNTILFNTKTFLKNIKNIKMHRNSEKYKTSKTRPLSNKPVKNQDELFLLHEYTNQINNIYSKKLYNPFNQKKESFYINIKNNISFLKNERKTIFLSDTKKNRNIFSASKNINKIDNIISQKTFLKDMNKKEGIKPYTDSLILNDSKNSIKWKEVINKKIFLSIFNKKNQVEMHLKPEYLGKIHVKINIQNNNVKLNFVSNNNEVRIFLDNYIPFLRDSLKKNGIKLEKYTICSSFKKELNNYKDFLHTKMVNINKFKKNLSIYKNNLEKIKHKSIDVYV